MKGGRGWWATVDVERLKQPSQRLNASTENTAWQKTGKHRERTRGQSIHIQHTNKPIRQNQKRKT